MGSDASFPSKVDATRTAIPSLCKYMPPPLPFLAVLFTMRTPSKIAVAVLNIKSAPPFSTAVLLKNPTSIMSTTLRVEA